MSINGNKIAVVVDPAITGYNSALEIDRRGFSVIALWSNDTKEEMEKRSSSTVFGNIEYLAEVVQKEASNMLKEIAVSSGSNKRIVSVLTGGEWGVPLAEALLL